jgi:hypothetical protein
MEVDHQSRGREVSRKRIGRTGRASAGNIRKNDATENAAGRQDILKTTLTGQGA